MKFNLLFKLFLLIVLSAIGLAAYQYYPRLPLLNPYNSDFVALDIMSDRVNARVYQSPDLDFSSTVSLPSITEVPRYMVYNSQNQRVYAAKGPTEKFAPASFTKLLSASVAIDLRLDAHLLQASAEAINKEPTILGIKAGEQFPLSELLRGAIATSANDAAAVIAQSSTQPYGGDTNEFVQMMNEKAALMSMKSSHFSNPEGYDHPDQYTTLVDIYRLISNVQKNYPEIVTAGSTDMQNIRIETTHGGYYLPNWNTLLGLYPGVNGLKIAYTGDAGYSTIVTSSRAGIPIVAIVSGANTIPERDLAAAALLDYAYQAEGEAPVKLTNKDLKKRYNEWADLSKKIKAEIEAVKNK